MRFVTARERKRTLDIEVTPMIDVVFLLIIFFMTTAQFARMTRAELALPLELGEQDPAPEEAGLVINVTGEGEIIV
ncbi:MAG: biopolymer transporter ExbD, partial [Phycisphaerales bacterium]